MQNRQALHGEPNPASLPDFDPPQWDETEQRILDAAAAMLATHGIEGLTITGLAKRAGVSRPTVYRRWSGTDEVVRATLLRTTITLFDRLGTVPGSGSELTEAIVCFSRLFREDPLFAHLLEHEPALFTRYSLERLGSSQRFMLKWIASAVETAQRNGTVRAGSAEDLAVMLLLIAQSVTLSHRSVAPFIGDAELDAQLRIAVDGYLRP